MRERGREKGRRDTQTAESLPLEREEDYYIPGCGLRREHSNLQVSHWSPELPMTHSVRAMTPEAGTGSLFRQEDHSCNLAGDSLSSPSQRHRTCFFRGQL